MADTAKAKTTRSRAAKADPDETEAALGDGGVAVAENTEAEECLAELRHKRGCPSKDEGLDGPRIEVIEHKVVGKNLDPDRGGNNDGARFVIVRCVDCGAQYPDE